LGQVKATGGGQVAFGWKGMAGAVAATAAAYDSVMPHLKCRHFFSLGQLVVFGHGQDKRTHTHIIKYGFVVRCI